VLRQADSEVTTAWTVRARIYDANFQTVIGLPESAQLAPSFRRTQSPKSFLQQYASKPITFSGPP